MVTDGDPADDLARRWVPSVKQDAAAHQAILDRQQRLPAEEAAQGVYTTHLLVDRQRPIWTQDVKVVALPGVYGSRDEASAACVGAVAAHRLLQPAVPVSAGYTWHYGIQTDDGGWQTHWDVREDLLAAEIGQNPAVHAAQAGTDARPKGRHDA